MTGAELRVVGTLVLAHARQRPARILLTLLSMIMAACIVVWVVSGYDSLVGQFRGFADDYLGRYDLVLIPAGVQGSAVMFGRTDRPLAKDLVDALRRDPAVAVLDAVFETNRPTIRRRGEARKASRAGEQAAPPPWRAERVGMTEQSRRQSRTPALVGTDSAEPFQPIVKGRWFDPTRPDRREGVITRESAEELGIDAGDVVEVTATRTTGEAAVTIVGITAQPRRLLPPSFIGGLPPSRNAALLGGPSGHAVYVPAPLAAALVDAPATATYAGVTLRAGARVDEFLGRWSGPFARATPAVEARTVEKVESDVDRSTTLETARVQALSAVCISLLAALFIVFTTLSMGVHERIRQFAILRAVSLTRAQVGAMIVLESLVLGLVSWGGGLLAGWILLRATAALRPEMLADGASLGTWCVVLSGLSALGGALAASVLPAWRAMSVRPLDAMAPTASGGAPRLSWTPTLAGLLLVAVNPLVVFFILPMQGVAGFGAWVAIGCTATAIGFALLAAPTVMLTESLLGPPLALAMRLNPQFLAAQLSSNLWRSVGTTISLTLGLGLFVAMQTWGYSMLGPFVPGSWTPDLVISIAPLGVPDSEVEAVRGTGGIAASRFVPLAVKQVKFAEDLTGAKVLASATRQENCVVVGVDPEAAFGGDSPVFDFTFAEGTRDEALKKLKLGRYCLVPDHFTRESGLGVGGKIGLVPPRRPQDVVTYEIAGVVSMPGWHWMTKVGFRRGRAAALLFSPAEHVRRDFDTGRTTTFWADVDGSATEDQIKAAIEPIAARSFDRDLALARRRDDPDPPSAFQQAASEARLAPTVTLRSADSVRTMIRQRADAIIWTLGELPLVTLLVTSLALVNTIVSSVRARQWDMGIMRATGLTRFGLSRLIVAESLLVGLAACLLSLGLGTLSGYCGTGITRYVNVRGGQITPLVIPWAKISLGFGLTLGLCLLAAIWPAFRAGRAEPLRLLQAGRSAA